MSNGNKFKGNKNKKSFRKKNPHPDFDENLDEYAKVISLQGGKHLTIQLLESKEKQVSAIIKGCHHRKIWYTKDELIIVRPLDNLYEVQGKVPPDELKSVQILFDKLEGIHNNSFVFDNNNPDENKGERKINANNIDEFEFDFDAI